MKTRKRVTSEIALLFAVSVLTAATAIAANGACVAAHPPNRAFGLEANVNNRSPLCKAVSAALNARCDLPLTRCEFRPSGNRHLRLPDWTDIPLYSAAGVENAEGFALLERLIRSRLRSEPGSALAGIEGEDRAVGRILGNVRARSTTAYPLHLERTRMTFTAVGSEEDVYQLRSRYCPRTTRDKVRPVHTRQEPEIFLGRVLDVLDTPIKPRTKFAHASVTNSQPDIFLFDEKPHLVSWAELITVEELIEDLGATRSYSPGSGVIPGTRCLFEQSTVRK